MIVLAIIETSNITQIFIGFTACSFTQDIVFSHFAFSISNRNGAKIFLRLLLLI